MALSGKVSTGSYQGRYYYVEWTATQSISGCYSDISWKLYCTGGTSSWYAERTLIVSIAGNTVVNKSDRVERHAGLIASGSGVRVSHNTSTGAGSFNISIQAAVYTSSVNCTASATQTLDTIPRAATISNVSNFTDEDDPSFIFSNPGNFNMECWLEPNPNGDHLAVRTLSGTSGTFKWTLTDEERTQLRKKCAGKTCTIRVGLYSNNKAFATYKDVTYSIVNGNPVLGANSWETTNHLDLVNSDTVIKGKSNVDVIVGEATPKKEATIKQYKVVIGSQIKNSETPTAFSFENVDASIINVYVEDSRGFVSSEILNISNFIEYQEPSLLNISAERSDGGIGSGVVLSYKGSMWSGNFGKKENTITVQYFYKKNGDSTWVQGITDITPESISSIFEKSEEVLGDLGALGFEQANVYDLKIILTDLLGSHEEIKIGGIPSGTPEMAFAEKGVAFNGFYDAPGKGVQFKGNVYDEDGNNIHLPIVDVIIEQGYSNDWYYRKWDSGIMECWRNSTGALGSQSSWGSLYTQQFAKVNDFPFEFTEVPIINVSLIDVSSGYNGWIATKLEGDTRATTTHPGAYQYVRGTAGTSGTATLSYYAIGKWK